MQQFDFGAAHETIIWSYFIRKVIILSSAKTTEIQLSLPMTNFQTMTGTEEQFVVILAELKNNDNIIAKKGVVVDNNYRKVFFPRPRASALPGGRGKKNLSVVIVNDHFFCNDMASFVNKESLFQLLAD